MPISNLLRDAAFGRLVRLITRNKFFPYPEEHDEQLWKKFVNETKSGNFAHHGTADDLSDDEDQPSRHFGGVRTREGPSPRQESDSEKETPDAEKPDTPAQFPNDDTHNMASGVKVDAEKGRDIHLIDWYGPDDPENPRNWSPAKKYFVTFEICFLTFSIYIGSSIYTAGILGVMQEFGVSQVVATVGLTLFVAGYGLGPVSNPLTPLSSRINTLLRCYSPPCPRSPKLAATPSTSRPFSSS